MMCIDVGFACIRMYDHAFMSLAANWYIVTNSWPESQQLFPIVKLFLS